MNSTKNKSNNKNRSKNKKKKKKAIANHPKGKKVSDGDGEPQRSARAKRACRHAGVCRVMCGTQQVSWKKTWGEAPGSA